MVPKALPPPIPPKVTRSHGVLRDVDNQTQPTAPFIFTEFK